MPHKNLASNDGGKDSGSFSKREEAYGDGSDGEAIKDERGRIVRQSLAFEDDEEPAGELHPAGNRKGGNGVRRRHDSAQKEADRPGNIHDPMRRGGNRERREHDASHGEKRNRAQIELELAPAHQEG